MYVKPDGTRRTVHNLGWLLRHARDVVRLAAIEPRPEDGRYVSAVLVADLDDGRTYLAPFASRTVLAGWLDRPSFRGLPLDWFGIETTAGTVVAE